MKSQRVEFANESGQKLAGLLEMPGGGEPTAYALFAHCFTCSKDYKAVGRIGRTLAAEGIAVLRFDFTGLGESEGDFADTSLSSNADDLVAAAEFLAEDFEAPRILIGHSLGGAAALQAASRIPSSVAVATIAAPSDPSHLAGLLSGRRGELEETGEAEVTIAGRPFRIGKQFFDDLETSRMRETVAGLRKALIVFHSPFDKVVGIENAARIFQAAKHPKSFVSLDTADHLLSDEADSTYVGRMIAAWAAKYVGMAAGDRSGEVDERGWVGVHTGRERYRTDIRARTHAAVSDEPKGVGGTDEGPTPYEYLLAALGACTSITLRMYADRKEMPLESVEVRLKHSKIHAKDCEDCETETGMIDVIEREIDPRGELTDAQRGRLLEIADMCPVHKTLRSETKIRTKLRV